MGASFSQRLLNWTLDFEGRHCLENVANDPGGWTYEGITFQDFIEGTKDGSFDDPEFRGGDVNSDGQINLDDLKALKTAADGEAFVEKRYCARYWCKNGPGLSSLTSQVIADKHFDASVNMGIQGATVVLQRALVAVGYLGISVDGDFGPRTLFAVNKQTESPAGEHDLLMAYCEAMKQRYLGIVQKKPTSAKFLKGWLRRAAALPPVGAA